MVNNDPQVQHEVISVYIQLAMSVLAIVFLTCCMVVGFLPPIAAIPLIVGVLNAWLRSPLDIASINIARIQEVRIRQQQEEAVHPNS